MNFETTFNIGGGGRQGSDDVPFRMLVVGDFGGTLDWRARPVEADSLDETVARMKPSVALSGPDGKCVLTLSELADLHPDRLLHTVPHLRSLTDLRAGLLDPARTESAATLARAMLPDAAHPADAAPKSPAAGSTAKAEAETDDRTVDRLMGSPRTAPEHAPAAATTAVEALIRRTLPDGAVVRPNAERDRLLAAVEAELSRRLRATLRDPALRKVEAAWRGLDFLARSLETGAELQLFAMHASLDEITGGMTGATILADTPAYAALARQAPWAAIVGLYAFGPSVGDADRLARLSDWAGAADAVFLAGADTAFWNEPAPPAWPAAWDAFRRSPGAGRIGLACPPFMLRLPYGRRSDAIESFPFEEIPDAPRPEDCAWGNPALLCAALLGQQFVESGWSMEPAAAMPIDDLPSHAYSDDGEAKLMGCLRRGLSDRDAERLLSAGLMPLLHAARGGGARLVRFQSAASPATALRGRWGT